MRYRNEKIPIKSDKIEEKWANSIKIETIDTFSAVFMLLKRGYNGISSTYEHKHTNLQQQQQQQEPNTHQRKAHVHYHINSVTLLSLSVYVCTMSSSKSFSYQILWANGIMCIRYQSIALSKFKMPNKLCRRRQCCCFFIHQFSLLPFCKFFIRHVKRLYIEHIRNQSKVFC